MQKAYKVISSLVLAILSKHNLCQLGVHTILGIVTLAYVITFPIPGRDLLYL